jgi:hypothetical protein
MTHTRRQYLDVESRPGEVGIRVESVESVVQSGGSKHPDRRLGVHSQRR